MRSRETRNVCFHGIGRPSRAIEKDETPYWITRDSFLRILDEVATWPALRLSFDDGNASDVEIALPALLERGLTATFFVLAGRLDTPGSLSPTDVVGLQDAGMTVGSHGMDHVSWRSMAPAVRQRELVSAREIIASTCARPVTDAALPRGQYDRSTLRWLRRLGYESVHTSDRRPARAGAWLQPRFSVKAGDSPVTLVRDVLRAGRPAERLALEARGLVKRLR